MVAQQVVNLFPPHEPPDHSRSETLTRLHNDIEGLIDGATDAKQAAGQVLSYLARSHSVDETDAMWTHMMYDIMSVVANHAFDYMDASSLSAEDSELIGKIVDACGMPATTVALLWSARNENRDN